MSEVKTLVLDIETFPAEAYVWRLFDENVPLDRLIRPSEIALWAAKWTGETDVYYAGLNIYDPKTMLSLARDMLDEADEVVTWNGNNFDLRLLNAGFLLYGISPPSPYKKIDLMQVVKRQMKFMSNKLDHVSQELGLSGKLSHTGFDMWKRVMDNDEEAWAEFIDYNVQDVVLTEQMYDRLRPWILNGVNRSVVVNDHVCPYCGSAHLQRRGSTLTSASSYWRWQCVECGGWSRTAKAEKVEKKDQLRIAR
jgi:predicted RNA-binding Zn-ribbon protein involved in translation (DUF1610 family)